MNGPLQRRELVLVVEVCLGNSQLDAAWHTGPLPRQWRVGYPNEVTADQTTRTAYSSDRLGELLYADSCRWHRGQLSIEAPNGIPMRCTAVEVVRLLPWAETIDNQDQPNALFVVHGELSTEEPKPLLEAVQHAVSLNPRHGLAMRAWVEGLLPPNAQLTADVREATYLAFVTGRHGLPSLWPRRWSTRRWRPQDQWLWHLYYSARYEPDAGSLDEWRGQQTLMSSQMRAVISVKGIVMIGLDDDSGLAEPGNFYDGAAFHAHTFYTDVLLLEALQRLILQRLSGAITVATGSAAQREALFRLERQLLRFRSQYWAANFAGRGDMDLLLSRCQQAHELQGLLNQSVADMAELSRQVQVAASEAVTGALGFLTLVGLPVTVAISLGQGSPSKHIFSLVLAGSIAVALVVAALIHPVARQLLTAVIHPQRRTEAP